MSEQLSTTSQLLLYLADELSPAERVEVDRILAVDPIAAAEFRDLSSMTDGFAAQMSAADGNAQPEPAALRRIGNAMRQLITDRLVAEQKQPAEKPAHLRYPWWTYPAAAAAIALIAMISWWGTRPDQPLAIRPQNSQGAVSPSVAQNNGGDEAVQLAVDIQKNFASTNVTQSQTSVASLDMAEAQIAELSRSESDSASAGDNE